MKSIHMQIVEQSWNVLSRPLYERILQNIEQQSARQADAQVLDHIDQLRIFEMKRLAALVPVPHQIERQFLQQISRGFLK